MQWCQAFGRVLLLVLINDELVYLGANDRYDSVKKVRFNVCPYVDNCQAPCCYEITVCPVCRGSKIFVGAGIGGGEPNYFGLQHPSQIPCPFCYGRGEIQVFCDFYE